MVSVARLSTTPVKALGLSHPDEISLRSFGVPENRRFLVLTPERDLFEANRHGSAMQVTSETDEEGSHLTLRFPDGTEVSEHVEVQANPFPVDVWGRTIAARLVAGTFAKALSSYVGTPLLLARTQHPGDGNDEFPVSLVSLASVERIGDVGGRDGSIGAGRFRMLLELDGLQAHEEDSWLGRKVRVGTATIYVAKHCARCVITTMNDKTGESDFPTLKTIAAYRGVDDGSLNFGMYAAVLEPGTIRVGDSVEAQPA
ncbi:MAG: MOSC domain-containing protein [Actinomycetota bacterium]